MHIEPGVVNGAKIGLSFLTGAAAIAIGLKLLFQRMSLTMKIFQVICLLNGQPQMEQC